MVLVMLLGGVAPLRGIEAAVVTVMLKGSVGQPLLHQLLSKKIAPKVRVVSHQRLCLCAGVGLGGDHPGTRSGRATE